MAAVKTTTTTKMFWDLAAPLIAVTEQHSFLVAMVDGTLAMDQFRYYVVQDALYLQDFADALRLLSRKTNDNENLIAKVDSERLKAFAKGAEEAEMALHNSFFREWDISAEGATQMPHTLLYTSYMKRIVATRPYAEGLAVLLPCFWVYAHVGETMLRLREQLGSSVQRPAPFDAWIDMYGGEDFGREVKEYIGMVDAACVNADANTLKEMGTHFVMCCKLEHMFWDQANDLLDWPEILVASKEAQKM